MDKRMIERIQQEMRKLNQLSNEQLILLALGELILSSKEVPPGVSISLSTVLRGRSSYADRSEKPGKEPK